MTVEEDKQRYIRALHGMQSGVATKMNYEKRETDPKHLRVGVNSSIINSSALAYLLINKGVITEEEWFKALADAMEDEKTMYEDRLTSILGAKITLS